MKILPVSILHAIGNHHYRDGLDFSARFDVLWEALHNKTARIKSFIDLMMGCECALKSHIFLCRMGEDPKSVYCDVRRASHDISALADYAKFLEDRSLYDFLKCRLGQFSVYIRYSLDSYETFFPSGIERCNASIDYSKTIGNNQWVLGIREALGRLLDSSAEKFNGFVTDDLETLFLHEREMMHFANSCGLTKKV